MKEVEKHERFFISIYFFVFLVIFATSRFQHRVRFFNKNVKQKMAHKIFSTEERRYSKFVSLYILKLFLPPPPPPPLSPPPKKMTPPKNMTPPKKRSPPSNMTPPKNMTPPTNMTPPNNMTPPYNTSSY